MKKFFINNYRAIVHILIFLEYFFFSWLLKIDDELLSLDKSTIPLKIIMLIAIYFTAEFSIKKSGIDKMCDDEKKKFDN